MSSGESKLKAEIATWTGFSDSLRDYERGSWDRMIADALEFAAVAVEKTERFTDTEPFFMALCLVEQKRVEKLEQEIQALRALHPKPPTAEG